MRVLRKIIQKTRRGREGNKNIQQRHRYRTQENALQTEVEWSQDIARMDKNRTMRVYRNNKLIERVEY